MNDLTLLAHITITVVALTAAAAALVRIKRMLRIPIRPIPIGQTKAALVSSLRRRRRC